jgi:hypothetical protein
MKEQRPYGVWMDTKHATIVGSHEKAGTLTVLGHVSVEEVTPASGNKHLNNQKEIQRTKFFKQISSYLENATLLHATGTGHAQEQFIHYLAEIPQFKKTRTEESTANKMSDERLVEFFEEKFN